MPKHLVDLVGKSNTDENVTSKENEDLGGEGGRPDTLD